METAESHYRLSVIWRHWGAGSVSQVKSESLRIWQADGITLTPSPKLEITHDWF
jgi:hypothetical protein